MGLVIRERGERTHLFGRTKEKVEEQWGIIDRDCLSFWKNRRGRTHLEFSGTPADFFWMDRDPGDKTGLAAYVPYRAVKKAIRAVLDDTAATCREHNLKPDMYIDEAAAMLEGLAESVYYDMAGIEVRLITPPHQKVTPEAKALWRQRRAFHAKICTDKFQRYITEQAEAAKLLAQRNEQESNGPGQTSASGGAHANVIFQNSNVTMGDIHQTQNLATGNRSSIGKETLTAVVASWLWRHIKTLFHWIWKSG